jgi:hypothetical protein
MSAKDARMTELHRLSVDTDSDKQHAVLGALATTRKTSKP